MSRTFKVIAAPLAALLLLVLIDDRINRALFVRATPPASVNDMRSFWAWYQHPDTNAIRLTDGTNIYYRVTGPAGRFLASGRAAYTFDAQGKFIGWTPDVGDVGTPGLHLSRTTKRERISLDDVKRILK